MPNTGKPSKDCHLCRSRRVKCDLGRPACQRCIKYGAECPGYRDEQDLVFRNSNPTTVKKKKKRKQQASREASEGLSEPSGSSTPVSTPSIFLDEVFDTSIVLSNAGAVQPFRNKTFPPMPRGLPRSMFEHWTNHSVPILLNIYENFDLLQTLYSEHTENGPLLWAAHLLSRTYVTNMRYPTAVYKGSVTETEQELGSYLGKALSSVTVALKEPDGAFRDDILVTVWILANYELLIGSLNRQEPHSPWHLHTRGMYSMLKARGTDWLYTERGQQAFWPAFNLIQVQCLITNTECPPETEKWLAIARELHGDLEGLGLSSSVFVMEIASIQARILPMLLKRDFAAASAAYEDIMAQTRKAEDKMNTFFGSVNRLTHAEDQYMLNMYYSACVKGYNFLLLYANFLTHHLASPVPLDELKDLQIHCKEMVQSSAQAILDSLPLTLDLLAADKQKSPKTLFDALKVVWPVSAVKIIPTARPEQRAYADKVLQFIGEELGVRQALRVGPGSLDLPVESQSPLEVVEDDNGALVRVNGPY